MKYCPKCKLTTDNEAAKFCKKCGTPLMEQLETPSDTQSKSKVFGKVASPVQSQKPTNVKGIVISCIVAVFFLICFSASLIPTLLEIEEEEEATIEAFEAEPVLSSDALKCTVMNCNYKASSSGDMELHKQNQHRFLCQECNISFDSENALNQHKNRVHQAQVSQTKRSASDFD